MLLDFWTVHYLEQSASGSEVTEFDNPDFDAEAIIASLGDEDDWQEQPHLSGKS